MRARLDLPILGLIGRPGTASLPECAKARGWVPCRRERTAHIYPMREGVAGTTIRP